MSDELPAVKTSEPPRVGPARWGRLIPYLVLISVVGVVVAFSSLTPEPVVEIPIPRPPALNESDGQELYGGFWVVKEMWLGSQLEYSREQEYGRKTQDYYRRSRGEPPVPFQYSKRLLRISSHQAGWPRRCFERLGCRATRGSRGYRGDARLSIPLVPASPRHPKRCLGHPAARALGVKFTAHPA